VEICHTIVTSKPRNGRSYLVWPISSNPKIEVT